MSPLPPSGNCESIGLVSVTIQPELVRAKPGEMQPKGYSTAWYGGKQFWIESLSSSDAIEQMYKSATSMGADALTQFSVATQDIRTQEGGLSVRVFEVSGFAIKRK